MADGRSRSKPTQFGPYRVLKALGAGTFGSVCKAEHEASGRVVAVKVLKAQWARDPDCGQSMRQQFAEEAKMMLQFDHPHVLKVSRWMIVPMLLTSSKSSSMAKRCSRERWHRDLKPANILLDQNDHVYLADFGLALDDAQRWRTARAAAGTYPYMAPKQINGATHRLNARCDIWALGVILYEMLTGRRPFRGESREQLSDEILARTPAANIETG